MHTAVFTVAFFSRTDKLSEFVRADFAQAFKSRHFRARSERFQFFVAGRFAVAVARRRFISHAEQRRFKDVHVTAQNDLFEIQQKIREHEISDMEAVVIGIGCNDDLIVAEIFDIFLNAERKGEVFQFFVFIERRLPPAVHIFGFSAE